MRTARGRVATPQAYRHLGLEIPMQLKQMEIRECE